MKRPSAQHLHRAIALGDRIVPSSHSVVIRTFPDYDDQCREVGAALAAEGVPITLLVDDVRPPSPPLDFPCRILRSTSPAAAWAFWRAAVVVHTHGVYGNLAGAPSKSFVNLWHGMPIKRLPSDSAVGRNQTDVTFATSPIHADHLAQTWGLEPEQVVVAALPRTAAITRRSDCDRLDRSGLGRPLAVWLPTFRSRPTRPDELDGTDLGTVTQFEGANLERVDDLMGRAGFHLVIKPHPAATPPAAVRLPHTTVWSNDDLRANGWTLYRLLASTDLLITDVSSVWIDFLAADRPIIFAMSDREEYLAGRGSYFPDLDALVPGRICSDIDELELEVAAHANGGDPWRDERAAARELHHPAGIAEGSGRAVSIVMDLLDHRRPGPRRR